MSVLQRWRMYVRVVTVVTGLGIATAGCGAAGDGWVEPGTTAPPGPSEPGIPGGSGTPAGPGTPTDPGAGAPAADTMPSGEPGTGPTYYLAQDGNDANPGTSAGAPWRTFARAARQLAAGDTLLVRGGRYTSVFFQPANSGRAGAPITIKAYPGEQPIISGAPTWDVYFNILGKSWITIDGLRFVDTTGGTVVYTIDASYLAILNCTFGNHGGEDMIRIGRGHHNLIRGNTFDTTGSPSGAGAGDHIYLRGSDYNLIEDNYFTRAGHYAIDLINEGTADAGNFSEYNVIRNNTIEQHWGGGIGLIRGTRHTVVEGNRVLAVGEAVTGYPKTGIQIASERNIVRRNQVVKASAAPFRDDGLALYAYSFAGIPQHARDNRIYNNVVYKAGRSALAMNQKDSSVNTRNKVVNNVFYYNRVGGSYEQYWPDGNYYLTVETFHANADNKWAGFPNGNFFLNNLILHADAGGDRPNEDPLVYYDQEGWGRSLAWVQSTYPTYVRGNFSRNPMFVDAERGSFGLRAGSPAIDAGATLARTAAAGDGTDVVPVDDPFFFTDGFGVVGGDLIRIGSAGPVRIRSVDYGAKTIRVESPVSFPAGAPVNLPYAGSGPDVGLSN